MKPSRYDENRFRSDAAAPPWGPAPGDVESFHRTLPGWRETPLVGLPALARELGVSRSNLLLKIEKYGLESAD